MIILKRYLTGITIHCEMDAIKAINKLHSFGISTIIIKSLFYEYPNYIMILGSSKKSIFIIIL